MPWWKQQPKWSNYDWNQKEQTELQALRAKVKELEKSSKSAWGGGQQALSQATATQLEAEGKPKEEDLKSRLAELRRLRASASEKDLVDVLDGKILSTKAQLDSQKPIAERLKAVQERVEASKERVARNHDHVARAKLSLMEAQSNQTACQLELVAVQEELASQEGAPAAGGMCAGGEQFVSPGLLATLQQLAEMLAAIGTSASNSQGVVTLTAEELEKMGQIVNASKGQLVGSGVAAQQAQQGMTAEASSDPYTSSLLATPQAAYHTIASSEEDMGLEASGEEAMRPFSAVATPKVKKRIGRLVRSGQSK